MKCMKLLVIQPIIVWYTVYLPTFTIKNQPNLGKCTIPMDGMGNDPRFSSSFIEMCRLNRRLLLGGSKQHCEGTRRHHGGFKGRGRLNSISHLLEKENHIPNQFGMGHYVSF